MAFGMPSLAFEIFVKLMARMREIVGFAFKYWSFSACKRGVMPSGKEVPSLAKERDSFCSS